MKRYLSLIVWFFCSSLYLCSLSLGAASTDNGRDMTIDHQLVQLQQGLDKLKQQVAKDHDGLSSSDLNQEIDRLIEQTTALTNQLSKQNNALDNQLIVLGPKPDASQKIENAKLTDTRNKLVKQQHLLQMQRDQANAILQQSNTLKAQIMVLMRTAIIEKVRTNSVGVFNREFWQPVLHPDTKVIKQFQQMQQQATSLWKNAWQQHILLRGGLLFTAILLIIGGNKGIAEFAQRLIRRAISRPHLQKSLFAILTILGTVVLSVLIVSLLINAFTYQQILTPPLSSLLESLVPLTGYCALVASLGQALLAVNQPQWRLSKLNDKQAKTLRFFPYGIAIILFIFMSLSTVNRIVSDDQATIMPFNVLLALVIAFLSCFLPLFVWFNLHRYRQSHEHGPTLFRMIIYSMLFVIGMIIFVAAIIGYSGLACLLAYQLGWLLLVLLSSYFIFNVVIDTINAIFAEESISHRWLSNVLHVDNRRQSLLNAILVGLAKAILTLAMLTILINGEFGSHLTFNSLTYPKNALQSTFLQKFNLVPAKLIVALLVLILSVALLRLLRQWLAMTILPKTEMEIGLQASIVTLVTNIGYVIVIAVTLAALGITWQNLAWIVSALSVGIGFGLQEIVKNFISGMILLTERPIKVGDLVSINGIEGDVKKINVRATEVKLGDQSTVIVPNSQFISQNVRNVTMGHATGVVKIELKFPLSSNPEQIRTILLQAYQHNTSILPTPAPTVLFKQIDGEGIVITVSGVISQPRQVGAVKSDLLFAIFAALRRENCQLIDRQVITINKKGSDKS